MTEDLWYKNAIIYSLDLETFMDANGDGIGDFEGLCNRLDYLHTLGINTIWLAPFQSTPNRDNGYDIKDYYSVDPRHGSNGSFVDFMHQAERRGIRVIIDLVVNHTSDKHPWFQSARKDKNSPYRDWYVWSEKKPETWNEGMVFPGVQKSTWTYDKEAGAWYHHRFYEHQPDLNTDNPEVRKEIERIMGYWLQLGVAGFRVDAVPFMIETISTEKKVKPKMHFEYLQDIRRFLQWRTRDAILLGEANVLPKESIKYFGDEGEGIHMMFNFLVNQHTFYALATGDIAPLVKTLEDTRVASPTSQWAQFLRNHDELDLGRLTEKQREKVFERFGPEENMQLYGRGLRRRLNPMLGSRQQVELAYSLMFSLPGTPVIRYGDEIGMGDDLTLNERDAVRTPMHWSGNRQAGFSQAAKLVHPVIDVGPFSYQHVNVSDQRRSEGSLLNWMMRIIQLRKECPEIGTGEWVVLDTKVAGVLALQYTRKEKVLIVLHNFNNKPAEVTLTLKIDDTSQLTNLLDHHETFTNKGRKRTVTLEAYGYRWLRVGSPDDIV
ncbi:MAG: trehalose synthase [Sphingobacteriales bacterium]|nr:MAG: trehalose synthase [Sphingobacteriales bacterium]